MESGNILHNLHTGEEVEEKEKEEVEEGKKRQLLYLRVGGLPGFVFVFHISMISSEFLLIYSMLIQMLKINIIIDDWTSYFKNEILCIRLLLTR
jgi:hypothetical protein